MFISGRASCDKDQTGANAKLYAFIRRQVYKQFFMSIIVDRPCHTTRHIITSWSFIANYAGPTPFTITLLTALQPELLAESMQKLDPSTPLALAGSQKPVPKLLHWLLRPLRSSRLVACPSAQAIF